MQVQVVSSVDVHGELTARLERARRDGERRRCAADVIRRGFRDPRFTVGSVSDQLHLSVRQLYRSFVGHESPADALSRLRASAALTLMLSSPGMSTEQIAQLSGFIDTGTMRDHLLRHIGMGVREIRRWIREGWDYSSFGLVQAQGWGLDAEAGQ